MPTTYRVRRRAEEGGCDRCGGPIYLGDHCTHVEDDGPHDRYYHPGCAPQQDDN